MGFGSLLFFIGSTPCGGSLCRYFMIDATGMYVCNVPKSWQIRSDFGTNSSGFPAAPEGAKVRGMFLVHVGLAAFASFLSGYFSPTLSPTL